MFIPEGKTESEVLEAIERQVEAVSPSFAFGYWGVEDVKQEARKFALEVLEKYDPSRPLDNFLYRHIKNRLINLKRDKFRRPEAACPSCAAGNYCVVDNGMSTPCKRHQELVSRNRAKAGLMRPMGMESVPEENGAVEDEMRHELEKEELHREIDCRLPVELRGAYLRILAGCVVPKSRRMEVGKAVEGILCQLKKGE